MHLLIFPGTMFFLSSMKVCSYSTLQCGLITAVCYLQAHKTEVRTHMHVNMAILGSTQNKYPVLSKLQVRKFKDVYVFSKCIFMTKIWRTTKEVSSKHCSK